MIVAFSTFAIALAQVLLDQQYIKISSQTKFIFFIVVSILSGIPLMVQFVILLGEISRARKYSFQLLLHRMMMNILGDYGPASNLLVMQYRYKRFGTYLEARGFWKYILFVGHGLAKFFGLFPFGDAFSGVFASRHVSVALWMDTSCEYWVDCKKPIIKADEDLFSKPRVKEVRDLSLTVEFYSIGNGQSTMVRCDVFATGSQDSLVSKLYYESLWSGVCPRVNALELCMLMETLNDDSFVVTHCPPMNPENGKVLNDQILACEELRVIVSRLLKDSQKLNAARGYGLSYV